MIRPLVNQDVIVKTGTLGELFRLCGTDTWAFFVWAQTKNGTKYLLDRTFIEHELAMKEASVYRNTVINQDNWSESDLVG